MTFVRRFAVEWVRIMGGLSALVIGGTAALVAVFGAFAFPVLAGSYLEFGSLKNGGVVALLEAGHHEWVVLQLVWMVMLLAAIIAAIGVHEERRAESNGGGQ